MVLVGMMGAGKTSVGREIAGRQGVFVDTDRLVEQRAGLSISEIFAKEGEPAFRRLEIEALRDAISSGAYGVVSTGGGIVTTEAGREFLNEVDAFVVWLTAPNEELARRASKSGNRPLLTGDPVARITELMKERANLYAEVADLTIDTSGLSIKQVAQLVEEALDRIGNGEDNDGR